jgi:hypothetical protein
VLLVLDALRPRSDDDGSHVEVLGGVHHNAIRDARQDLCRGRVRRGLGQSCDHP